MRPQDGKHLPLGAAWPSHMGVRPCSQGRPPHCCRCYLISTRNGRHPRLPEDSQPGAVLSACWERPGRAVKSRGAELTQDPTLGGRSPLTMIIGQPLEGRDFHFLAAYPRLSSEEDLTGLSLSHSPHKLPLPPLEVHHPPQQHHPSPRLRHLLLLGAPAECCFRTSLLPSLKQPCPGYFAHLPRRHLPLRGPMPTARRPLHNLHQPTIPPLST